MAHETDTTADVAAEIAAGGGLALGQAARRFPSYRNSRPVNPSTVWRWLTEGVRLPSGRRLRLEAARVGGRWLTSAAAIERFIRAQTPTLDTEAASKPAPATTKRTAKRRAQDTDRTRRELDRIGI
jgi:Protein of unknown function (DUF1580)